MKSLYTLEAQQLVQEAVLEQSPILIKLLEDDSEIGKTHILSTKDHNGVIHCFHMVIRKCSETGKYSNQRRIDIYHPQAKLGTGGQASVYELLTSIAILLPQPENTSAADQKITLPTIPESESPTTSKKLYCKMQNKEKLWVIKLFSKRKHAKNELANLLHAQHIKVKHEIVYIAPTNGQAEQFGVVMEKLGEITLYKLLQINMNPNIEPTNPYFLDIEDLFDLSDELMTAIAALHNRQLIHRDIKPDNIVIYQREDGRFGIKIIDLSMAKKKGDDDKNILLGTYGYISPEALHHDGTSEKSDIYALALVLLLIWGDRDTKKEIFDYFKSIDKHGNIEKPIPTLKTMADVNNLTKSFLEELIKLMSKSNPHERPNAEEVLSVFKFCFEEWNKNRNTTEQQTLINSKQPEEVEPSQDKDHLYSSGSFSLKSTSLISEIINSQQEIFPFTDEEAKSNSLQSMNLSPAEIRAKSNNLKTSFFNNTNKKIIPTEKAIDDNIIRVNENTFDPRKFSQKLSNTLSTISQTRLQSSRILLLS
jgi:serine/threonine protein kinase